MARKHMLVKFIALYSSVCKKGLKAYWNQDLLSSLPIALELQHTYKKMSFPNKNISSCCYRRLSQRPSALSDEFLLANVTFSFQQNGTAALYSVEQLWNTKDTWHLEASAAKDVLEEVPSDCTGDSNLCPSVTSAQQSQSLWAKSGVVGSAGRAAVPLSYCETWMGRERLRSTTPALRWDGDLLATRPSPDFQGWVQDLLSVCQKEAATADTPNANSKLLSSSPGLWGLSPCASNGLLTVSPAEQQM